LCAAILKKHGKTRAVPDVVGGAKTDLIDGKVSSGKDTPGRSGTTIPVVTPSRFVFWIFS